MLTKKFANRLPSIIGMLITIRSLLDEVIEVLIEADKREWCERGSVLLISQWLGAAEAWTRLIVITTARFMDLLFFMRHLGTPDFRASITTVTEMSIVSRTTLVRERIVKHISYTNTSRTRYRSTRRPLSLFV